MTKKVIVHEGRTTKHADPDVYTKSYIGLEWDLPDEVDEATIAKTMIRMRSLIRQELGAPNLDKVAQIPEFNPEDLMKHDWKGKKDGKGGYLKGSTAWGWDFKDKFPESVIKALEKAPITIDQYEFTLGETIVNAKKKK